MIRPRFRTACGQACGTANGVKTVAPAAADAAEFRALGATVAQELVGKLYDQAMLDEVKREVASARAAQGASGGAK